MPDSAPLSSAKLMPKVEELRVTTGPFPASRKVHERGRLHREISVALREIDLDPSAGEPPVRAYDTSGPYSDPTIEIDINRGLPELRKRGSWRAAMSSLRGPRGSSPRIMACAGARRARLSLFDRGRRQVLRAKRGATVTQLAYARRGVITQEMEYVAIRENLGREKLRREGGHGTASRSGASIPEYVTPEFVAGRDRARPRDHSEQHQPPETEPMIIGRNFLVKSTPISATRSSPPRSPRRGREDGMGRRAGAPIRSWICRPAATSIRFREWIIRNSPVPIGTVPIYQALEKVGGKAEELTWELFRDTLIEQAEQGVDYFTIHAGVSSPTSR